MTKQDTAKASPCCNAPLRNVFREKVVPEGADYDHDFCSKCGRCEEWFKNYNKGDDLGNEMMCLDCGTEFSELQNPFYDTACPDCLTLNICAV